MASSKQSSVSRQVSLLMSLNSKTLLLAISQTQVAPHSTTSYYQHDTLDRLRWAASILGHLASSLHNTALLILLIKLSEELSDPPSVEYYSPDGKSHDLGVFPLSNELLLVQADQFSPLHCSQVSLPHVETGQSQTKTVIIGTRRTRMRETF